MGILIFIRISIILLESLHSSICLAVLHKAHLWLQGPCTPKHLTTLLTLGAREAHQWQQSSLCALAVWASSKLPPTAFGNIPLAFANEKICLEILFFLQPTRSQPHWEEWKGAWKLCCYQTCHYFWATAETTQISEREAVTEGCIQMFASFSFLLSLHIPNIAVKIKACKWVAFPQKANQPVWFPS